MTKKVYRTSQGKSVDIGALMLQNETVRAVGNMGVNARGDRVNPQNNTVDSRNTRIGKQYKRQISNVVDDRVVETKYDVADEPVKDQKVKTTSKSQERIQKETEVKSPSPAKKATTSKAPTKAPAKSPLKTTAKKPDHKPEPELELAQEPAPVVEDPVVEKEKPVPAGGLADAIARARTVKQEPLKTPRQISQSKAGVRKI